MRYIILTLFLHTSALGFVKSEDSWGAVVTQSALKDTSIIELFGESPKYPLSRADHTVIRDMIT